MLLEAGRARVDAADEYGRTCTVPSGEHHSRARRIAVGADPTRPAHGGWTPFISLRSTPPRRPRGGAGLRGTGLSTVLV